MMNSWMLTIHGYWLRAGNARSLIVMLLENLTPLLGQL
jgi:hypothetical protein